jgi:riboflavin kinase/FMN adenylyltransferase
MEVVHGLEKFPSLSGHSIVAIGNFDGIHLGHHKILKCLEKKSKGYKLFSLVLTFFPHPGKILGKNGIKMIQSLDQRIEKIKKYDIQALLVLSFDEQFASLNGQDFIQKIVLNALHRLSSRFNFRICSVPSVVENGEIVSSSLIRRFLQEGKIKKANRLLGHSYEIEGEVTKGKSRGKILGFPTANIESENEIIPQGVFITQTRIGSKIFPSMSHIGKQPTFNQHDFNIESHIIDFDGDLYGKRIGIHFLQKIRDEIKFSSPDELTRQLEKDLETTQSYFRAKS